MENITAETMPAWLVAVSWIYAGFIWITTRKTKIRMDSRIWGITFMLTGFLYLTAYIPSTSTVNLHSVAILEFRLYFTRILMMLLSASMWLPLTISYFRIRKENELDRDTSNSSNSS